MELSFHQYAQIEKQCSLKLYFSTPYPSWERGSSENVNGLIRQYLLEVTSMAKLTQPQSDVIAYKLNNRSRKRHNYKTPMEKLL
jgi:IS30 family transposase